MPEQKPSPRRGKVDANAVSRRMRVQTSSSYREILSREKAILENPRLRSNESPSGAFKRQSGLRKQMEGLCPDKLRRFSRIAK